MTTDPQKHHTTTDDIDLLLLLEGAIKFFRRYKWVYIIAVVLGLSSGFFVYKYLPKIYTSGMVVHSFLLTNQEQIQITENWSSLLGKGESGELAKIFNCSENILKRVKKIKAEEIQKVFSTVNPHGFTIKVNVTDNAVLDELQKGIVYGFENSEYVNERLDVKRARLKVLIDQTSTEIRKLDSTKKIIERIIAGKGAGSSAIIIDAASANRQLIEMNERMLAFKEELKFTNAVQVLQSFSKFRRPTGPKLIPWLVIGLMVFLSLAFLYSSFRSISEKMKSRSGTSK
ncbi:MAG TPA: hypothetical protein VIZ28_08595 [Chitinophagaceae bacterium]